MADTSLPIQQKDPLNILEPWKKVCLIDEDELVCLAVEKNVQICAMQSPLPLVF